MEGMSAPSKRFMDNITAIVALLVFGAGFVALFAGFDYFFLIWILGWIVLVPIVAILSDEDGSEWDPFQDQGEWDRWMGRGTWTETTDESDSTQQDTITEESTTDALSTLRERYASGDLTDEQFERKLDRLLETETPEDATEWRERTTRETEAERSK
jgi:hypothetical protein